MKYKKLADGLISLLNGMNVEYKMYSGKDGQRTSNPYSARYIFVPVPNLMFIIDEDANTLDLTKSGIPFVEFKPILKQIKNITRRLFVNLNVHEFNKNFSPRDFSTDYNKRANNLPKPMSESINSNMIVESYERKETVVEVKQSVDKTLIILDSIEAYGLPYYQEDIVNIVVESALKEGTLNYDLIHRLYKMHSLYTKLDERRQLNTLSNDDKKKYEEIKSIFS